VPSLGSVRQQAFPLRRYAPLFLLVVASLGFLGIGLLQAWSDSPTFDEPVYVSSGLAAILHHDVTLNEEHPPLPKVLAALPVLFVHPVVPPDGNWTLNNERIYGATFVVAQLRAGKLRSVTLASRLIPLLEAAGLAFLLYGLGRDLFGRAAGTLAGLLWLFSPFVLGLGHLNSVDISFAVAVVGWSWTLLRWCRRPSTGRTVALGLVTGAAILSDVTGLLLAVIAAGAVLLVGRRSDRRRGARQCAVVIAVAWASLWAFYAILDFHVLADPTVVLPLPYLQGIGFLGRNDTVPGPGYLFGIAWTGGRWWYWPGALLAKTVPSTLVLLLAAPIGWLSLDRATRRHAALVLGLPALCLAGFTVGMPRDIGVRYLLPVIALWLVAAGSIVRVARRSVVGTALVIAALGLAGVATVLSAPNSLAWVTVPFQPSYQVVSNSDVDWGQGLYRLQSWAQGKHAWVAYFGPRGIGVDSVPHARSLLGTDPARVRGWVAVSATDLTSAEPDQLAWLRAYCPVGNLGESILLYRFARPPSAVPGPTRPVGPCPAGTAGFSIRTATGDPGG
jgi:4-amino-4-deoxy-L-arabinose transferase-like glycosyltransferase